MKRLASVNVMRLAAILAVGAAAMAAGGCKAFLDPSEVVRSNGERLMVPILSSLDPVDEVDAQFAMAREVKAQDLVVEAGDYVIGKNDLLTISIFDLVNAGVESVRTTRVSESGTISLPLLSEPVKAAGLTEAQLQRAVAKAYKDANIIMNAQVAVTVVEARQRTFSILGSVNRPGQYVMVESNFRILDALVLAADVNFPVDYLYVIRRLGEGPTTRPADTTRPAGEGDDVLAPRAAGADRPILAQASERGSSPAPTTAPAEAGRYVYLDGEAHPMAPATAAAPEAPGGVGEAEAPPVVQTPFEFGAEYTSQLEIIRVPLAALKRGEMQYNIVVRPNDTIVAPAPEVGEYYMGGHVAAAGVYSLTGRQITLKQAVISARMLDPLAIPKRTDVIRRIGKDREVFVRVDLEKIFEGRQSDIYLRPNDIVQVGTDVYAPFLAAVRGAFRMTYGFGFVYDRNYAYDQNGRVR